MSKTVLGPDNQPRCSWCGTIPEFFEYHDKEWGFPVSDDRRLFEKLCLESFQSGLSWRTILNKRENFRAAFKNFEIDEVAKFNDLDLDRLLNDAGIVRNRGKIEAVINNAKRAQELIKNEGSLAAFLWRYEPKEDPNFEPQSATTSKESIALSKELKKRGWKFVGPTTAYAFMQSMGLINDHASDCIMRKKSDLERAKFTRPQS